MDNLHRAPPRPHGVAAGGREDCWSEGATETLIEAWGDRYLQLNRGNLRQKDWKEVADAVNGRDNGTKPRRTDVQCKNRVDTLKKKYKLERTKPPPSKWPFYFRLEHLIGNPNPNPNSGKKPHRSPTTVTLTVKSRPKLMNSNPNPNPNTNLSSLVYSASSSRLNSSGSTESSLGDGGGGRDDEMLLLGGGVRKHSMMEEDDDFTEETAFKELARAIVRFGEVYERIESAKQQQMMELEKQRMEFTKELEYQRMNMFMEAQLELEKMKRPAKYPPGAGKKL